VKFIGLSSAGVAAQHSVYTAALLITKWRGPRPHRDGRKKMSLFW